MKRYRIDYTHKGHGPYDDTSMTFCGLTMLDALAYMRHLAVALNMQDFRVLNVYAETDDGRWAGVPDWADTEYRYQMYLAEKAEKENEGNV